MPEVMEWLYRLVTDGDTSCTPITTQEECQAAARALNLAGTTASVQTGTGSYDPPYCFYSGSHLWFNPGGTLTGSCSSSDQCLCVSPSATASTVYVGQSIAASASLLAPGSGNATISDFRCATNQQMTENVAQSGSSTLAVILGGLTRFTSYILWCQARNEGGTEYGPQVYGTVFVQGAVRVIARGITWVEVRSSLHAEACARERLTRGVVWCR